MKIHNTQPIKVYRVTTSLNEVGREIKSLTRIKDIQGLVDEQNSSFQVELYGDRVKRMINLYSNELIDEDCQINYKDNMYKIIGIKSTTVIQPVHHIYTLEMI